MDKWPERLSIRDTKIYDDLGGLGQRIFTTAGAAYEKHTYYSEEYVSAKQARIEALENDFAYHSELCTIQQAKISELKAKQRWIPVSECLPPSSYGLPRSSAVLVYTPTIKCMFTATYDYDRGLWQHFGRSSCEICEEVSHWMSLPEPAQ